MKPDSLHFRGYWIGLGWLMIAVVLTGSLISIGPALDVSNFDKAQHLIAYGAMMFWWGMVQPRRRMLWAVGLLIMGLAVEWLQSLTGYRTLSLWDALANAAGVLCACLLLLTPARRLLPFVDGQLAQRLKAGIA